MQCPNCHTAVDDDTIFCGNCGRQIAPQQAEGATVIESMETLGPTRSASAANGMSVKRGSPAQAPTRYTPSTPSPELAGSDNLPLAPSKLSSQPRQPRKFNMGLIVLLAILVVVVIVGGTIGLITLLRNNTGSGNNTVGTPTTNGTVKFIDNQNGIGHNDALTILVNGLSAPPSGSQYYAWIVDTASEQITALGMLGTGDQSLTLKDPGDGTNLLAKGNKVEITLEQGTATAPTGKIVLSSTFPPNAFVHIRHLLVHFDGTPRGVGLLAGLLNQAQQLNAAAAVLQGVSANHRPFSTQCAAQSIIDIAEGIQGTQYKQLDPLCASKNVSLTGDGYGLLGTGGYIANSRTHASLAATQNDSTQIISIHAKHVEIATDDMQQWVTTIDNDALALLNNPGDTTKVAEIVKLANQDVNGVDINGDESVDPVLGEAGAIIAYIHGQYMASLTLL